MGLQKYTENRYVYKKVQCKRYCDGHDSHVILSDQLQTDGGAKSRLI